MWWLKIKDHSNRDSIDLVMSCPLFFGFANVTTHEATCMQIYFNQGPQGAFKILKSVTSMCHLVVRLARPSKSDQLLY